MAKLITDDIVYSPLCSSIFINLKEDGHGCKNNCNFCVWKKTRFIYDNFPSTYIVPTNDDIDDFLVYSRRKCVTLSGGGDPLYNYSKNKIEIKRIVDHLHSKGRYVELITRDYETFKDNFDELTALFDGFSFSVGSTDQELLEIIKRLGNEKVRVSYVTNGEDSDLEFADELFQFFGPFIKKFYLKEDYMNLLDGKVSEKVSDFCTKRGMYFGALQNYEIVLIGDKITTTRWMNDYHRNEFKKK